MTTKVPINALDTAAQAALRDRSTHTGSQAIATVSGLQTALNTRSSTVSSFSQAIATISVDGYFTLPSGTTDNPTDSPLQYIRTLAAPGYALTADQPVSKNALAAPTGAALVSAQAPYPAAEKETVFEILKRLPLSPTQFGAVPDFDFATWSGTVNDGLQKMFNAASQEGRDCIIPRGEKYLTERIRMYYDPINNPDYAARPGRFRLVGEAPGLATGAVENVGAAIAHIDGATSPLFDVVGAFSIENPSGTGGFMSIQRVNMLGGSATTAVMYLDGCQGQMTFGDMTVRIKNVNGIGVDENTTWETNWDNSLIRGTALALGPNDPGYDPAKIVNQIGLNIRDNGSGGQVNMKVYRNINTYRVGYGVRIGRRGSNGTFGPLVFLGGQAALSDHHGVWIDGGVYALEAIGFQIEQSVKNGLRIDSAGASDIERQIKWSSGYFTHCGRIEDGTANSFAINVVDGENVTIDQPTFRNCRSGITFDRSKARNLLINRPQLRDVSPWGAANGTFIDAYGALTPSTRIKCVDPLIINGTATIVSAAAEETFARGRVGEVLSISTGSATPNISLGSPTGQQPAAVISFNNGVVTNITDILGGRAYQELTIFFTNSNTTIVSNANIYLDGNNYTPSDGRGMLLLRRNSANTAWNEVSRSRGVADYNDVYLSGTSAASGTITIAHGQGSSLPYSLMEATAFIKGLSGEAIPMTFVNADATNVTFSSSATYGNMAVRAHLTVRPATPAW